MCDDDDLSSTEESSKMGSKQEKERVVLFLLWPIFVILVAGSGATISSARGEAAVTKQQDFVQAQQNGGLLPFPEGKIKSGIYLFESDFPNS